MNDRDHLVAAEVDKQGHSKHMPNSSEAFSRVVIDAQLAEQGWTKRIAFLELDIP